MADKYQAFDPKAEVNGYSMLGFIQCVRKEDIWPYLEAHDLTEINPEGWYPVQKWLDVLSDLAEMRPGQAMFDFVAVGMKVTELSPFPPEWNALPFHKALVLCAESYMSGLHRGGDVGEVRVELVNPKHIKENIRTPYPDDFWYGICYGGCRRFLPPGTHFTVYYDPDAPRREQGGEWTLIHITWE